MNISAAEKSNNTTWRRAAGFTIVELLIVIVVIAILAAITITSYAGVTQKAESAKIQEEVRQIADKIEEYNLLNGYYPKTQSTTLTAGAGSVRIDANCTAPVSASVYKGSDWVPDLTDTLLPQSDGTKGSRGDRGCYVYQSDGTNYILSAWNMVPTAQTGAMYRRVGFREMSLQQYYLCNHPNIGGANPSPYNAANDMYKYSYTITNITTCSETPPSGA